VKRWWQKFWDSRNRKVTEDALKYIHDCEWHGGSATPISLAKSLQLSTKKTKTLYRRMLNRNLVQLQEGTLVLTEQGEQLAVQMIRAHRLWERFLVDEARMPLADVHAAADRQEHNLGVDEIQALDAALGHPTTDPHGDPIPTAEGKIQRLNSVPLTNWPLGKYATIVHLEDEPVAIFSQIAALGLYPGQRIRIITSDEQRIVFTDDCEQCVLAPIVAANIHVTQSVTVDKAESTERLHTLPLGHQAHVLGLDESLKGYTRRRLLDLGLTAGAAITPEYRSFLGDPVAYRVRGALIALRDDQAMNVMIQVNQENTEVKHE